MELAARFAIFASVIVAASTVHVAPEPETVMSPLSPSVTPPATFNVVPVIEMFVPSSSHAKVFALSSQNAIRSAPGSPRAAICVSAALAICLASSAACKSPWFDSSPVMPPHTDDPPPPPVETVTLTTVSVSRRTGGSFETTTSVVISLPPAKSSHRREAAVQPHRRPKLVRDHTHRSYPSVRRFLWQG